MIIIRADCNSKIGIGHIMRCVSIADQIKKTGGEVLFVCADDEPAKILEKYELKYFSLGTAYDRMVDELPVFTQIIRKYKPDCLLIDSYQVSEEYFKEVKKYVKTAYIDDLCQKAYLPDILINYNIQADISRYEDLYLGSEERPKFILGLEYVPLRQEFTENKKTDKKEITLNSTETKQKFTDVLLSTGGADPMNISMEIAAGWIDKKNEFEGAKLHIVCGPFYKYVNEIKEAYGKRPEIELHFNVEDMVSLMDSCQAAIASTGSTIYELCARGIPTVSFYFVENQRQVAEAFAAKTPVTSAGDFSKDPEGTKVRIFERLKELNDSGEMHREISDRMMKLIDGHGAARIAERLK